MTTLMSISLFKLRYCVVCGRVLRLAIGYDKKKNA